jgi:rhodanese-related sulfurtransferase
VRSVAAEDAWRSFQEGETELFDLRTQLERRRYGWPPGVKRVSLARHILFPHGPEAIYLCQHANRSKLTGWRGATEVAGGWPAWQAAGLPIQHTPPRETENARRGRSG